LPAAGGRPGALINIRAATAFPESAAGSLRGARSGVLIDIRAAIPLSESGAAT
jgi:hypothetical protein